MARGAVHRCLCVILSALPLVCVAAASPGAGPAPASGVFNVLDYGAKGDGATLDTAAVQSAIDAAGLTGGGIVLLPSGHTFLCGSLWLASNVVFRVAPGATLLGSAWYNEYPQVWRGAAYSVSRAALINGGKCLDNEAPGATTCANLRRLTNVTIDGGGVIDGQGQAWWYAHGPAFLEGGRACTVEPMWVDGLTIRDVKVVRSPYYHIHPTFCTNVLVDNVNVTAEVFRDAPAYGGYNTDGIDPENCVNVTISNSWVWSGDDCVAIDARAPSPPMENLHIHNLTCHTPISIGSGTRGGVRNVLIENSTVIGGWGDDHTYKPQWWHTAIRIKTARGRGGYVTNVTYRDIMAVDVDLVFDFQMWYPCQNSSGMHNYFLCQDMEPRVSAADTPHFSNITFTRVTGVNVWRPAWLNCLPEAPCEGVVFQDVSIQSPRAWECTNVAPAFSNVTGVLGSCA